MSNGFDVIDPLDVPMHGAENIGRAVGVVDSPPGKATKKEKRKAFYACGKLKAEGVVDSFGRSLVTTPRRLRNHFGGKGAAE
jgi:hypothetical protein